MPLDITRGRKILGSVHVRHKFLEPGGNAPFGHWLALLPLPIAQEELSRPCGGVQNFGSLAVGGQAGLDTKFAQTHISIRAHGRNLDWLVHEPLGSDSDARRAEVTANRKTVCQGFQGALVQRIVQRLLESRENHLQVPCGNTQPWWRMGQAQATEPSLDAR